MGRYQKFTADYFPHFSNLNESNELTSLVLSYGMKGYGIYFRLQEILCKSKYFILKIPETLFYYQLFLVRNSIDLEIDEFKEFILKCVNINLFNKKIYEQGYLFSETLLLDLDKTDLFKYRETKPFQLLTLIETDYQIKIPIEYKNKFKNISIKTPISDPPNVKPLYSSKKMISKARFIK